MNIERINQRFQSIEIVPYAPRWRTELEELTNEMHDQSMFSGMTLNVEKTMLTVSMATGDSVLFRVAVRKDRVLGAIFGYAAAPFFSDDLMGKVIGVWVAKQHQGSAAFVRLLQEFEQWAKAKGARLCFLDQTTALDMVRSQKLFEGCGYSVCGVNTYKEL